jgi:hypothetical protein
MNRCLVSNVNLPKLDGGLVLQMVKAASSRMLSDLPIILPDIRSYFIWLTKCSTHIHTFTCLSVCVEVKHFKSV